MIKQQVAIESRDLVERREIPLDGFNVAATTSGGADIFATVAGRGALLVERLAVANITGTAATLNLHAVPSGGSIGNDNAQLVGYSVPANTAVDLTDLIGGYYPQGTEFRVWSDTANALTLSGYGTDTF